MRGMRSTMTLLAAAAVLLAGCGGDDEPAPPAGTPAPSAAPRDGSAGSFPQRPQLVDDFSDPGSGWPRAAYREGSLIVDGVAFAPRAIRPPERGTLAEVVVDPPAGGRAGLICRAAPDAGTGYALLLGRGGAVELLRLAGGAATVLKRIDLAPNERSRPALVRLACGTGAPGSPVTLAYTVNASPYGYVTDPDGIDPGDSARVGLVSRGGPAAFDDFALSLAG